MGTRLDGQAWWRFYGNDLDAGYGDYDGLGGLWGTIDAASGAFTPVLGNAAGHILAHRDADGHWRWRGQQFSGYGPHAGFSGRSLLGSRLALRAEALPASLGWQGRTPDPTGFYCLGQRLYDAGTGRFLSPDPLGHAASADLYSYAGGDPINHVDPTGRSFVDIFRQQDTVDLSGFNLTGYNYANPRDANYAWLQQVWDYRYADTQTFDEMKFEGMLDATYGLMSGGLYDIARGDVSYTTALGMLPYVGKGASLFTKGARTVTNASRAYNFATTTTSRTFRHFSSEIKTLRSKWDDIAGQWKGFKQGFADTGKFKWSKVSRKIRDTTNAKPYDVLHHRIIPQGGTRKGAGKLSFKGFLKEQYGRYVPNFIKNSKWNITNLGQPLHRGGTGVHEALHGTNPDMRLNIFSRIWQGTNKWDKAFIAGSGVGTGLLLSDDE